MLDLMRSNGWTAEYFFTVVARARSTGKHAVGGGAEPHIDVSELDRLLDFDAIQDRAAGDTPDDLLSISSDEEDDEDDSEDSGKAPSTAVATMNTASTPKAAHPFLIKDDLDIYMRSLSLLSLSPEPAQLQPGAWRRWHLRKLISSFGSELERRTSEWYNADARSRRSSLTRASRTNSLTDGVSSPATNETTTEESASTKPGPRPILRKKLSANGSNLTINTRRVSRHVTFGPLPVRSPASKPTIDPTRRILRARRVSARLSPQSEPSPTHPVKDGVCKPASSVATPSSVSPTVSVRSATLSSSRSPLKHDTKTISTKTETELA